MRRWDLQDLQRHCAQKAKEGLAAVERKKKAGFTKLGTGISWVEKWQSWGDQLAEILTDQPESPSDELLDAPTRVIGLSVRVRKCMARLGITTVGELIQRTGDELLECRNFGVTSLNEVRDKLSVHGLKLRDD